MVAHVRITITPEAMQFAKNNKKPRDGFSKNRPLYCIHYRGAENGSICVDMDTLDHIARLCKFPSTRAKEDFLNNFLGTIPNFPQEAGIFYDWLYKASEEQILNWRHVRND